MLSNPLPPPLPPTQTTQSPQSPQPQQHPLQLTTSPTLPMDIIKYILQYDERFVIRNGKIIQINKINNPNKIYRKLHSIPQKKHHTDGATYIYLPIKHDKYYYFQYFENELVLSKMEYRYATGDSSYDDTYGHPYYIERYVIT